ncbi:hypothetical protein N3K66_004215 [Trichothecium roseum]|uniref:Uncharacterized protein n=1 Tax=Trichothecium roseum TaxID=47278 RepID=A0ACC0V2A5_9HYPO|nr:hypothetical protein N3K66_004215 [Trichothecium roseum]
MASPTTEQLFISMLRSDHIKDHLLPHLRTSDICAVRSASAACSNLLTKRLFTRVHISFSASTFTKQSRVAALARVGHHVEHLTFSLPHSEATFLPPLVHPATGGEISFLYSPHTSMGSVLTRPKYANTELGEILTQQYPPLFHAATNVPSFINALRPLSNLRHLTVRCPGQDPAERYRRSTVDYALISLRIAVERAPLEKLHKLSLSSLHPGAFNYLRHNGGYGAVPSAGKRWSQIRKLSISVESWDFHGPSPGTDHLKMMEDYVRNFAGKLEKFSFGWVGHKGPCPVALPADAPLFGNGPQKASRKLFHEVTSPMSPLPTLPPRPPVRFPRLRYMQVRNATMSAAQLKDLIQAHRDTVKQFDFESVVLANQGSWEDALSPVARDDSWSRSSSNGSSSSSSSQHSVLSSEGADDFLSSPSAAVEAASRELLDLDLGGFGFSDEEREVIESLSSEVAAAASSRLSTSSDGFSTKIKRKRTRRHHHSRSHSKEDELEQAPSLYSERPPPCRSNSSASSPRHPKISTRLHLHRSKDSGLRSPRTPTPTIPEADVSAPILSTDSLPVLLQPTVYDPAAARGDQGISTVQRNIEQEQQHRRLAEDAGARTSALQRAKEAVLMKLSREFCSGVNTGAGAGADAAAVAGGRRMRQRPTVTGAVSACRMMPSRDFMSCGSEVLEDRMTIESQTALVPLIFSRA